MMYCFRQTDAMLVRRDGPRLSDAPPMLVSVDEYGAAAEVRDRSWVTSQNEEVERSVTPEDAKVVDLV